MSGSLIPDKKKFIQNIAAADAKDSLPTAVIRPAEPTNCSGKGKCSGCRECNPVPPPYGSYSYDNGE